LPGFIQAALWKNPLPKPENLHSQSRKLNSAMNRTATLLNSAMNRTATTKRNNGCDGNYY